MSDSVAGDGELQQLVQRLRRAASDVEAAGRRLEHLATTAVWHSAAADAFRGLAAARRREALDVAASLERAAALLVVHAAEVAARRAALAAVPVRAGEAAFGYARDLERLARRTVEGGPWR
jgi:hypothetical protein